MKLQSFDLNDCIRNVDLFLRRIIGEDIKLILSLKDDKIPILADHGHIEQVLMNLATNARDAMPDGGILSIGTDIITIDDEFIRLHGYGTSGRHAVISIADNGSGMDEAIRLRIFEPFFTTKDIGRGTGLGLSIIYGIVNQHKGHISVYSEPGQGTTFRILLPLISGDVLSTGMSVSHEPLRGGHETILVVDDDAAIRQYLGLFLTELGYTVQFAEDGQKAIDVFRERPHNVDLVLMDLIMPNKNGSEAAHEIRRMRSNINIIFTSGYPHDIIHDREHLEGSKQLLMKPLTPTDLAKTLRAALDGEE